MRNVGQPAVLLVVRPFSLKYVRNSESYSAIVNRLREAQGAPVRVGELVEALYYRNGDDEPDYAENCIRVFILRLRRDGFPIQKLGFGYCWTGDVTIPLGNVRYDPRTRIGELILGHGIARPARIAA